MGGSDARTLPATPSFGWWQPASADQRSQRDDPGLPCSRALLCRHAAVFVDPDGLSGSGLGEPPILTSMSLTISSSASSCLLTGLSQRFRSMRISLRPALFPCVRFVHAVSPSFDASRYLRFQLSASLTLFQGLS